MQQRHIGNNWVPLVCLSLLFLFTGAVSMVGQHGNGASSFAFVIGSLAAAAVSAGWLWRRPTWWVAPRRHYLYLAGGTAAGVLLGALIPFDNGCGPWLVLGASVAVYGYFERLRLLVTVGAAVAVAGFLAMVVPVEVWGGAMHLTAAAVLAFGANRLYVLKNGRRRESQESDPAFIGFFEEFDGDEPPNFWQSSRPK
ncbi:hypothetical protein QO003_002962 [Arthrobacter silviterrae]|uniref:Uncharacterized protein n=1 Tax=Arthrobacter silviterrae TaxID=2026658 RepID=A0ABX0D8Y2_9MICC|nr:MULTISPECIES: hypothetical protein [Arthrobacter]MCU6479858.1 hypothetical protein [Arthrobacter sp. A2-55]MDQ0278659.1 hypothetical protein [Arthrobacter silviterrae]NGN83353.1 hypothetical protein [Arthrobacter silviterrae]